MAKAKIHAKKTHSSGLTLVIPTLGLQRKKDNQMLTVLSRDSELCVGARVGPTQIL